MKTLHTIILSVVTIAGFAQTADRKVSSQIKEVTVFLQGAQVTRTANVELKPGSSTIVLNGTSPHIQENSIQAEANMGVKIVGVSFRVNYMKELKQPEEEQKLQKELERLSDLIYKERTTLKVYEEEEVMLKSNKSIGSTMKGVDINELKVAVDYFRQRMIDIQDHRLDIETKIANYEKEKERINLMLLRQKTPAVARPEGEIVVKFESKSDVRVALKVSYLVNEAGWFPTYDIRAKDIDSPIAITYKANIAQQSGENWENVKLTVSSANPNAASAKPVIQKWILGFNNYGVRHQITASNQVVGRVLDENGSPVPGVNVVLKGTTIGTTTDIEGNYSIALGSHDPNSSLIFSFIGYMNEEVKIGGRPSVDVSMSLDVAALEEVVVTGYGVQKKRALTGSVSTVDTRGISSLSNSAPRIIAATPVVRSTNLEFTIDNVYTITSGGQNQSVDMIEYEIPADYEYYTAPKLDNDAFLTARMTDWDGYNFLEGQASIFFEGKYIGKTVLDTRNTSDTLTLSLGRDKNVVVTREKVKEFNSTQFVGSNRRSMFAYEISVRNKKANTIKIRVEDQLPIANTKDISIDDIEDTKASKDPESGVLTWNLKVEPGKTEKINLRYEVKYPKYQNIILE